MTLVLTVNGYESIWMLADRRLSSKARVVKEDARKVMFLDTLDGRAILGYAGLGATKRGTEPSDWMSSVLRGTNLPLERSLGVLAEAMEKQFPPHMRGLPGIHNIIVTAFLGNETRLYTIDLDIAPDRKTHRLHYGRRLFNYPTLARGRTPPLWGGGTGAQYLRRDMEWTRNLLRLVKAYDSGRVSPYAVADYLASLNNKVHLGVSDNSVGPGCIVAWLNRKGGVHKDGGRHRFYTGTTRDANTPSLPTIAGGLDLEAISGVLMPHTIKALKAMKAGEPIKDPDHDELNAEFARLPDEPDENLR